MRTDSFQWSPEFSVGNQMLDAQHKKILTLCADIEKISRSKSGYAEQLHGLLNEMAVYARTHFKTEEALLEMYHYPDLELQREEHLQYLEDLGEILNESLEGSPEPTRLLFFLQNWWIDHILYSDMQYKAFISVNGKPELYLKPGRDW